MTSTIPQWIRVSRQEPCVVCHKTDWCTRAGDGTGHCCMRVESDRPMKNGGWFHKSTESPRPVPVRPATASERPQPTIAPTILLREWAKATPPALIVAHAESLGVDPIALAALGCVWANDRQAFAFPMRDGMGNVVGIRYRNAAGDKWAEKGSKAGLFIPMDLPVQPTLYVCEGPTSTAAIITLGFFGIGRHNCSGNVTETNQFIHRTRSRQVVIVADNDTESNNYAGQRGAEALQQTLRVPSIIYQPPAKDIRDAIRNGLDAQDITNATKDLAWTQPTPHRADTTRKP